MMKIFTKKQDSPPAENRKRHTTHNITNPSVTCPGKGQVPCSGQGDSQVGVPLSQDTPWNWGTSHLRLGYPLEGTWDQSLWHNLKGTWDHSLDTPQKGAETSHWVGYYWKDMKPVEVLWDGDGVPPLQS